MFGEPVTVLEAPPVSNVDIRSVAPKEHSDSEVTGARDRSPLIKTEKTQRKNLRQRENHMRGHRPVPVVNDLPSNNLGKLIPAPVVIRKRKQPLPSDK